MSWLKKNWIDLAAIFIALTSLIISVWYAHKQSSLENRLAHLHIEPEIKTYFNLSQGKNPVFVIANVGNIPAASVSATYRTFIIDKETRKILSAAMAKQSYAPGVLYSELLKPSEHPEMELLKIDAQGRLIVYEFNLKYFRESDMHEYKRTDYYFIDAGMLLNHAQFRTSPLYRDVMVEIAAFTVPKNDPNQGPIHQYFQSSSNDRK